jgi:hypothetical protein
MANHLNDIAGNHGHELLRKGIVLGIMGNVAAYEAPDIARTLIQHAERGRELKRKVC